MLSFALLGGLLPSQASASPTIDSVQLGLAGMFKVGLWCEATVDVSVDQPRTVRLTVQAPDSDGNPAAFVGEAVDLSGAGSHRLRLLFKAGRLECKLQLQLQDESGVLATQSMVLSPESESVRVLKQSVFLLGTIGRPAGFDHVSDDEQADASNSVSIPAADEIYRVAHLSGPGELPAQVAAMESLDALVIAGEYGMNNAQSQAIRDWVRSGGHLIVSVGSKTADYRNSPLSSWVPAPTPEQTTIRDRELSGFESFSGKNERINVVGRMAPCAAFGDVDGVVRVAGLTSQPLLVRIPYGFGLVTLFALDLERPPLSEWKALRSVTRKVLAEAGFDPSDQDRTRRARLTHSGITELASQLYTAQQQFPQVRRLSTWTIMGLMLAYLVIIGPVDYLLVHRLLKMPRLTWVTFPAMVLVAATLAAYGAAATNGTQVHVSQLDVIDVDAESQVARCQSWLTLYSPETRRYDLQVETPEFLRDADSADSLAPARLSPHGVAENVFGGMYRPGGLEIVRPGYSLSPEEGAVRKLPIPIWSTKSFVASRMDGCGRIVESKLESTPRGQLQGSIAQHLPVPIESPILAYRTQVYQLTQTRGDEPAALLPGQRWFPASSRSRDLNGYLTLARSRRVKTGNDLTERIVTDKSRYDQQSRDPTEILRIITFQRSAGGDQYTGLENNVMRAMDLTRLLHAGRAVLFGKLQLNAAPIELNGERIEPSRHAAYVRIVLPVTVTGELPSELPRIEQPKTRSRHDD